MTSTTRKLPTEDLTDEQKEKLTELRTFVTEMNLDTPEAAFCTDIMLYRYLLGLDWNMDAVKDQLTKTIEWRKETKPQNIKYEDLAQVTGTPWLFRHGVDKDGRPVMYIQIQHDTVENTEDVKKLKFLLLAYYMEQGFHTMPEGAYNFTYLVDFKNASLNMELINKMRSVLGGIGLYYPENMAKIFVINAGWVVNILWGFVATFMSKRTLSKYVITNEQDLINYFDEDQLLPEYGGTKEYEGEKNL